MFSLLLDPPSTGDPAQAAYIRRLSQQRDARPVEAVDAMISQALKRHELKASKKTDHIARTQGSAEPWEQNTSGAGATVGQKKPHAPRSKTSGGNGGDRTTNQTGVEPSSRHLIYEQSTVEPAEDSVGEFGEQE